MLMEFEKLKRKWGMRITGVLHVGAHLAEEAPLYARVRVPVWWVEANPQVLEKIEGNIASYENQSLIHALVYEEDDVELDFNVTNYDGMSSSILEFGTHTSFSPDTVFVDRIKLRTSTIDSLVADHGIKANFLNMDLQGAELHALKGATEFLGGVDYILTEVNMDEVYVGCAQVEELDEFLEDFLRVETYWVPGQGWGDALYLRK